MTDPRREEIRELPPASVATVTGEAARLVARALDLAAGRRDPGAGERVLKRGVRSVVWLDAAGPVGEAVVVKSVRRPAISAWLDRLLGRSPAARHRRAAELLRAHGFATPQPLAVVDGSDAGGAFWSSVVSRAEVAGEGVTVAFDRLDPRARRRFARALGRFFGRLHAAPLYVPDLRDENLLVRRGAAGAFEFVIVDLDRGRALARPPSRRRRRSNLIQIDRSLGWVAVERERLAFLGAYRRTRPEPRPRLRELATALDRARRRKDRKVARRRRRAGIVPAERTKLSCIVVTGNEIAHIRDCLESARFCDQLVVVDSFSTDGTLDVCREYTADVMQRSWRGYRDQKAFALGQARHPWVLNLDADERVSPELRAEIEEILHSDGRGYDGFTMPRLVYYLGRWWRHGGWYPDRRLRLFRRERASWGGVDPHEHVLLRGRLGHLRGPLWHYTYDDIADHVATIDRFTTIASTTRGRSRAPMNALALRPIIRFVRFYVLRMGFRMGLPGLFAALSAAVYVHLKYAKRDELAAQTEQTAPRPSASHGERR